MNIRLDFFEMRVLFDTDLGHQVPQWASVSSGASLSGELQGILIGHAGGDVYVQGHSLDDTLFALAL